MRFVMSFATTASVLLWGCGASTTPFPIPDFLLGDPPMGPSTPCPTIGFDGAGPAAAPVTTLTSCGVTVTATTPNWIVCTGYGHPAPFIGFMSAGGERTTGEIRVTAAGGKFKFESVDLYSSITTIPYVIVGLANSVPVFSLQSTQGNTYGNFATISNPNADTEIDTLVIQLSNSSAPCCLNPMGLDNIVLR